MPGSRELPFGGSADARAEGLTLAKRFRRHADSLHTSSRSPLCTRLMYAAADDVDAGGVVAELFDGVPAPPGSVPQLRLLGALHHLVLCGRAPELAMFYPSVGGDRPVDDIWPVAKDTLRSNFARVKERLPMTVQTNEPGRAAALYVALLWLASRYEMPIRLLELGASAGLNLLLDRYRYETPDHIIGDPKSPVRFADPWQPPPDIDLLAAARELRILERAGCDLAPLNPAGPEDRLTLLSFIWPDELDRFNRSRAALEIAASAPPRLVACPAEEWLPDVLAHSGHARLTVVWHSIVRQYIAPSHWERLQDAFGHAVRANPAHPIAWLSMEPTTDHLEGIELTLRTHPDEPARHLAWCGDHGPPIIWGET